MTFYKNMEDSIKSNGDRGLEVLEYYNGMMIELYRDTTGDIYNKVHGRSSGGEVELVTTFKGVIEGSEFSISNEGYSSDHIRAILYTKNTEILAGDTLKLVSEDIKSRKFKVIGKRDIGFTTSMFTMWGLVSLGD